MKYVHSFRLFFSTFSILLLCVFFLKKSDNIGLNEQQFIRMKFDAQQDYNIIFAGDSRIMRGINPDIIENKLHLKAFNFAFNALGYGKDYLDSVKSKIDIAGKRKIIVLGITPKSLTPFSLTTSEFKTQKNKSSFEKFQQRYLSQTSDKFKPISISNLFLEYTTQKVFKDYNSNGWMSLDAFPMDESYAIKLYSTTFKDNRVSDSIVHNVLVFVHECTRQGFEIYGIRPPVSEAIYGLEAEDHTGFNAAKFIDCFEQNGGRWLDFNVKKFEYSDGSHLSIASANNLSADIADTLSKISPSRF